MPTVAQIIIIVDVLLEYIDLQSYFQSSINYLLAMLALCLMLLATYYAQNYAGIIGWSLATACSHVHHTNYIIQSYQLKIAQY